MAAPDIWVRYVRLSRVEAYLALGWVPVGNTPLPVPHGFYSILMEWTGDGEPKEPVA